LFFRGESRFPRRLNRVQRGTIPELQLLPACGEIMNLVSPLIIAIVIALASSIPDASAADAGRDIAANCATCHGTDGRSRGGAIPSLAGRDKTAIVQDVRDFRDGKRPSTVMQQLAKGYTDAQIEAAASYLAAQKAN
jgi:sulfide dehydrogenase cytochrome subunit